MTGREVISIIYNKPKSAIGELMVDAFISESHAFSNEISEHPIDSGFSIVDHIQNKPISLSLDGIISNTPMDLIGLAAIDSVNRLLTKENNNFSEMSFKKIEELFAKREPITIATSLKSYPNMVLESLTIERGGGGSEYLSFKCTAKQIRIVEQERIKIPEPKASRVKPKLKKGLQETKPVPEQEVENIKGKSMIFSLGKKLFGG